MHNAFDAIYVYVYYKRGRFTAVDFSLIIIVLVDIQNPNYITLNIKDL